MLQALFHGDLTFCKYKKLFLKLKNIKEIESIVQVLTNTSHIKGYVPNSSSAQSN